MSVDLRPWRRPEWSPVPYDGCVGVESKLLLHEEGILVAILRFSEHATINEHPGLNDTVVFCLAGKGFTSVGDESAPIRAGEEVRWPKSVSHRLWIEGSTMQTLMLERWTAL